MLHCYIIEFKNFLKWNFITNLKNNCDSTDFFWTTWQIYLYFYNYYHLFFRELDEQQEVLPNTETFSHRAPPKIINDTY